MNKQQWFEINSSSWAFADSITGEVYHKLVLKDLWQHKFTQYLTLEQAKAAVENAFEAEKIKKEQDDFPWNV